MSSDKTRQHEHSDLGFCSQVNCAWNEECDLGLVKPRIFKDTTHAKDILGQTSLIFNECQSSALVEGFEVDKFRQSEFAQKLHPDNVFEAV